MAEHIEKTIAEAEARLRAHEQAVRDTKRLINQLRSFAGQPAAYPEEEIAGTSAASASLRGDEYVGKVQHTAARMILERRRALGLAPCTLDEIYADLVAGGYQFDAKTEDIAKRGIAQTLSKNTSVFVKLPNGKYGLLAWYPGMKKPKKPAGAAGETQETESPEPDEGDEGDEGDQTNETTPPPVPREGS